MNFWILIFPGPPLLQKLNYQKVVKIFLLITCRFINLMRVGKSSVKFIIVYHSHSFMEVPPYLYHYKYGGISLLSYTINKASYGKKFD